MHKGNNNKFQLDLVSSRFDILFIIYSMHDK